MGEKERIKKSKDEYREKGGGVGVKDLVLVTLGCAMHRLFCVKYPDIQHVKLG